MELMDVILKRRSIRKYTGEDIPEETLNQILQAGLLAPTSRNLRPWEFYVVRDKETLRRLSAAKNAGGGMLAQCSAAIAVFGDGEKADTWVEDCSIAMSFMMLMAEENVREILGVPAGFRIAGILSLGIPAEEAKAHAPADADWGKVHRV